MRTLKTKLRIGKISYTNALPFYHGLEGRGDPAGRPYAEFEFFETYPTKINEAMEKGEIDIAPISSLAYLKNQKDYLIIPHFAIGSRDFSGSVLLISKEKIENLNGKEIAVTPQSLSSVALLKILLKKKFEFENKFTSLRTKEESSCVIPAEAGIHRSMDPRFRGDDSMVQRDHPFLLIGDEALFFRSKEFIFKYDLSELWWEWTGKPFCFALWVVRRELAQSQPEEVAAFVSGLRQRLITNLLDLEVLIRESLRLSLTDEVFTKVFGYLHNLNYHFDSQMREGLEHFFQLASEMGLAAKADKFEFFEEAGG